MSSTDRNSLSGFLRAALSIAVTSFIILLLFQWLRLFAVADDKVFDLFSRARHSARISSIVSIGIVGDARERAVELHKVLGYLEKSDVAAVAVDSSLLKGSLRADRDRRTPLTQIDTRRTVISCSIKQKDDADPSFLVKSTLPPVRRKELSEGFVSTIPDSDSVVRLALLRVPINEGTMSSLALKLYSLYLERKGRDGTVREKGASLTVGGRVIPLEKGRGDWGDMMRINFAGAEHFRPMSSDTFMAAPADFYKGSVVFLLDSEASARFMTPVGRMSAMSIEAEALNTMIEGTVLRRVPKAFSAALAFLICLLSAALVLRIRKISTSAFIIAVAMTIYFMVSFLLFIGSSVLSEILMPLMAAAVSFTSAVIYRMNTAEKMLEVKTSTLTDGDAHHAAEASPAIQAQPGKPVPSRLPDSSADTPSYSTNAMSLDDFRKGEVTGKYRIIDRIGSGGMGEVFLVMHMNLNVRRAIKVIKPEIMTKPGMKERFRHEAEAVARLDNKHIITVHDYEEINGVPCIEMEYFESRNLRSEMKRGVPMSLQRALQITDSITDGLEAAHGACPVPMIHRDLKPENVLVSLKDSAVIKIIDFGLVKVLSDDLQLTSTSAPMGTPYYMAPEQIKGGPVGPSTDIYAMGVILFELLTGYKPFEKDSYIEILNQHLTSPVPSVHAINPSCPRTVDAVIHRAMEKDPANRYSDAREFHTEFAKAAGGGGEPLPEDPLAKTL
jgi:CHASE2 domain-containing sensor protein/tRNA A-37 threonylcarbamoyl transferase component Bud32